MTLLAKIARRRPADLLLASEAFVLLAFFRVCLALVPVRRIIGAITRRSLVDNIGTPQSQTEAAPTPDNEPALAIARRVRWAVEAIARHSPAAFVCFPQTLAGYTMLRRRHVPSTMVYGVARSPEGDLIAHTWLTLGDRIVLGGEGAGQFTPIERWI